MNWISETYLDLLKDETKAFGCLATLMKDGSPQLTPIWFNTDGKHIIINTSRGTVKERNIRRDRRVAFVIADPKNPYRYIQIRGNVVEILTDGAREHINALAKKYTGADQYAGLSSAEVRVMIKILPKSVSPH